MNDLHHESEACDSWFSRLFSQVTEHSPDLLLLLGDLAHRGELESLASIKRFAQGTGIPFHVVPGNHDKDQEQTPELYESVFPDSRNYWFSIGAWQFVGLDTTDCTPANNWHDTHVSEQTLSWLDATLPELDPRGPTILFTHFPLSQDIEYPFEQNMTPINANCLLDKAMQHLNLQVVLSGHFHGSTLHSYRDVALSTGACCSRVDHNFGEDPAKGWRLCTAHADGRFDIEFVPFDGN
ncbi:MAG: hypothetical protein F6K21_36005 [Symploca sp. SIO2D2]|nr:hypothetical protein [Symploca sp. SIO2D2]